METSTPDPSAYQSVAALLRRNAEARPEAIFLQSVDDGRALSFAETYALAGRLARLFAERGIQPGDRVLVLSENSLEQLVLYFAVLAYGATYCTINVEVNAAHVREMTERLAPKLVIADRGLEGAMPIEALFLALPAEPAELPDIGPEARAVISFTSGTSAAPKGVIHQHGNYFRIAEQTIDMWKITAADRILEYRSFSWASSHMLTLMPALCAGAAILFAKGFSRGRLFAWIAAYRPTVVIGVPTVVNMLLEDGGPPPGEGFAGVRFMSCSTAPLMDDQHRRFEQAYGIELVQLYGMSEGGVVAGNHVGARRIGSVGPPGLYQNLLILGQDGRKLAAGETGEIEIGGAQTAYGYLNADGTVERIRGRRLKTGDLGTLDPDGYLHVTGRAKDVIIRGGVNIAPLEIDNALAAHPDIAEAASIGVADPVWGEAVVCYVAPRPGAKLSEQAVRAHCAATLPEFKRPRDIVICAEIAKNDRGKIDRIALKEAWQRARGPA